MDNTRSLIFLVDDNITNLTMGKNILKTFYRILAITSAGKMFDALEDVIPDLILLDIEMPEMNGYEAIKLLKIDDRFVDIPVMFLTANADENSELEGLDLGATDYITKPFSTPLLLKRIEKELLIVKQKKELLDAQEELRNHLDNLEVKIQ
jgi:putative two-component system response regulator